MILSFFSICPDSMGNISFSDFCHRNTKHFWTQIQKLHFCLLDLRPLVHFIRRRLILYQSRCFFTHWATQRFNIAVYRNLHGRCGSQDTSCRSASPRGRSISPSACTPAQTDGTTYYILLKHQNLSFVMTGFLIRASLFAFWTLAESCQWF